MASLTSSAHRHYYFNEVNRKVPVFLDSVRVFLPEGMRKRALAGQHLFLNKVEQVIEAANLSIEFCENSDLEQYSPQTSSSYSLFYMLEPINENGLTFRKNYFEPFWKIETNNMRWTWPVAKKPFEEPMAKRDRILRFADTLRKRELNSQSSTGCSEEFVFVPLQGKLLLQRSFQMTSPIEMLSMVAEHMKNQTIVANYHPGERYSEEELSELDNICRKYPNVSVSDKPASDLVAKCSCVVTENSSVSLLAYLLHKPCILFADIDFHHIALKVNLSCFAETVEKLAEYEVDYDGYLWWFFQEQSINAGKAEAEQKILSTLRRHGWTI